jgi:(E)-4-hydroxy-3-methylbut-2-enyl-diphosphate synthase
VSDTRIADKAMSRWRGDERPVTPPDAIDPFSFSRRVSTPVELSARCRIGGDQPPRVIVRVASASELPAAAAALGSARLADTPAEGLLVPVASPGDLAELCATAARTDLPADFLVLETAPALTPDILQPLLALTRGKIVLLRRFTGADAGALADFAALAARHGHFVACEVEAADLTALSTVITGPDGARLWFTLGSPVTEGDCTQPVGRYRRLAEALRVAGSRAPIWIRNTTGTAVRHESSFLSRLLEASFLTGGLLCDGVGDLVSIETEADPVRATRLAYNVLQGAGARISKTEFVACPSCGRTLFDLQTTTQRIRAQTGHLKGVKIAIMGCIVNGPGEMADADFGYVGGAPGKINLYVGKTCVQYNIPQAEADARLIALIREHGKWADRAPAAS